MELKSIITDPVNVVKFHDFLKTIIRGVYVGVCVDEKNNTFNPHLNSQISKITYYLEEFYLDNQILQKEEKKLNCHSIKNALNSQEILYSSSEFLDEIIYKHPRDHNFYETILRSTKYSIEQIIWLYYNACNDNVLPTFENTLTELINRKSLDDIKKFHDNFANNIADHDIVNEPDYDLIIKALIELCNVDIAKYILEVVFSKYKNNFIQYLIDSCYDFRISEKAKETLEYLIQFTECKTRFDISIIVCNDNLILFKLVCKHPELCTGITKVRDTPFYRSDVEFDILFFRFSKISQYIIDNPNCHIHVKYKKNTVQKTNKRKYYQYCQVMKQSD